MAATARAGDGVRAALANLFRTLSNAPTSGGLQMPTDPLTLLLWLILASLAIAALAWWLRNRDRSTHAAVESTVLEPTAVDPPLTLHTQPGREFKIAIGSAGIKGIVREGRVE